jgi:hypothetical protein
MLFLILIPFTLILLAICFFCFAANALLELLEAAAAAVILAFTRPRVGIPLIVGLVALVAIVANLWK